MFETDIWIPLYITLKVAGIATGVSALAAILAAWLLGRRQGPLPLTLDALCTLPLVLPPTVLGYHLILLVGRRGLI